MPHFGQLLRRLRGGRSQRVVAAELNMPVTTLSTLENQPAAPRGYVLRKLAAYYGVSETYFYSSPATEMKPSRAASVWLRTVRDDASAKDKIATFAEPGYPDHVKDKIAQRIAEELSEKKRGNKTSHSAKT